jgi:hypothetical protein
MRFRLRRRSPVLPTTGRSCPTPRRSQGTGDLDLESRFSAPTPGERRARRGRDQSPASDSLSDDACSLKDRLSTRYMFRNRASPRIADFLGPDREGFSIKQDGGRRGAATRVPELGSLSAARRLGAAEADREISSAVVATGSYWKTTAARRTDRSGRVRPTAARTDRTGFGGTTTAASVTSMLSIEIRRGQAPSFAIRFLLQLLDQPRDRPRLAIPPCGGLEHRAVRRMSSTDRPRRDHLERRCSRGRGRRSPTNLAAVHGRTPTFSISTPKNQVAAQPTRSYTCPFKVLGRLLRRL